MTIKEEKLVKNYIKGLIRESLGDIDDDNYFGGGLPDHYFDDPDDEPFDYEDEEESTPEGLYELRKLCEEYAKEALFGDDEEDDEELNFDNDEEFDDEYYEPYHTQDYGIYELRKLCEGMARNAFREAISESKKKSTRKSDGKKKGSKKGGASKSSNSQEKSIMSKLNSDGVNAASYYYKLYGAKTEKEKASARSKGYKKAKAKKNDSGARYRFTSKERNRLNSMLTDK